MRALKVLRDLSGRARLRLAWDLFMVWAAVINLSLILFDLTYLWLRPAYFSYLPVITRIYDPVKGIEPHPLTEALLREIEQTRAIVELQPEPAVLQEQVEILRRLTLRVIRENPFERSGQSELLAVLRQRLADATGFARSELDSPDVLAKAVDLLWPADLEELRYRLDHLDAAFQHDLELNYYRSYTRGGRLADHFWIIDLPFLTLFWIEFAVRWGLALRRHTYAKWFFFPIFNWYDLLGLIPLGYFRIFRLLRAVSMYMRLRRSELSVVGKDIFTRTVEYFSNIITEEVSDRVALRILSELHDEIADGTHRRIVRSTVEPRLDEIQQVLVRQLHAILTDQETLENLRSLLQLNLDAAVDESEAFQAVPMPKVILRPLVRATGEVIMDATLEAIATTLDSPEGQQALDRVASSLVDAVAVGPGVAEIERLAKEIALQVIDHMKQVVAVKKWTLPPDVARTSDPRAS